jgi:hypothetical protein
MYSHSACHCRLQLRRDILEIKFRRTKEERVAEGLKRDISNHAVTNGRSKLTDKRYLSLIA